MYRHLATHLAVLAIGLGAGVGTIALASQAGNPTSASGGDPAASARPAGDDDPVVDELRKLNRKIDRLNAMISRATRTGLPVRISRPAR